MRGKWQSSTKQADGPGLSGRMAEALGTGTEDVCASAFTCLCTCVYVCAYVFMWLCFGAESLARLGKSTLILTASAP